MVKVYKMKLIIEAIALVYSFRGRGFYLFFALAVLG
jgi:hypothetical protein